MGFFNAFMSYDKTYSQLLNKKERADFQEQDKIRRAAIGGQ